MRRISFLIAAAFVLTGAALLHAQSSCRGECDLTLRECKQSCVDAQNFDQCVDSCRGLYEQCLDSCE